MQTLQTQNITQNQYESNKTRTHNRDTYFQMRHSLRTATTPVRLSGSDYALMYDLSKVRIGTSLHTDSWH